MKTFLNDGLFSERDFEKILLGVLLTVTIVVILSVYIFTGAVDANLIYLSAIELTAFVARKGLSYIKPDRYYQNTSGNNAIDDVVIDLNDNNVGNIEIKDEEIDGSV